MFRSTVRRAALIIGFTLSALHTVFAADITSDKTNTIGDDSSDAILKLNNEFLNLYGQARSYEIEHCGPIIMILNGKAVLLDGKSRQEACLIPPEYNVLKTADHTTLAIYVALKNSAGKNLSAYDLNVLNTLRQRAQAAQGKLGNFSFSKSMYSRQWALMQTAIVFMDKVISRSSVSSEELEDFVQKQIPLLMKNADNAAAMELGNLDKQIQSWRKAMPPDKWNKVHVVICDEHMPRQDERYVQYFFKLFDEKQEGQRVIYQEGSSDEKKALKLLGTHLLDASIAKEFFDDPYSMHHDLLSTGARKYLEQH